MILDKNPTIFCCCLSNTYHATNLCILICSSANIYHIINFFINLASSVFTEKHITMHGLFVPKGLVPNGLLFRYRKIVTAEDSFNPITGHHFIAT